jgi:hypothetical protein
LPTCRAGATWPGSSDGGDGSVEWSSGSDFSDDAVAGDADGMGGADASGGGDGGDGGGGCGGGD